MSTSEVSEPDEDIDDELPRRFLIFTCPDFDQNEDKAREASAELDSARARRAREQLLRVLGETDGLVFGVGGAHDALIFHWNTAMTSVSR